MRIPALTIIILFLFSFLVDWYIAFDVKGWSRKKKAVYIYWISAAICWIFLIVTLSLPRRSADSGISTVMWMLFSYLTLYTGKLSYVICSAFGRFCNFIFKFRTSFYPSRIAGILCCVLVIGIMWMGVFYTRHKIEVVEETVESQKLPPSFNGYRIVQISDLHVGTWGNDTTFISKLVNQINSLTPDVIFFTGDIVNRQTKELKPFLNILSKLTAKDGVYSVLGNHDYGDYVDWKDPKLRDENNTLLALSMKQMGWRLLNNERVWLRSGNDSILLAGVENWGDPPFPTYGSLEMAIPSSPDSIVNQNDSNFKILLTHNPEHWNREVADKTNINLTLSGHTHGMQTMMKIGSKKWSPAKYRYELWGGKFSRCNEKGDTTHLYVNIGAGEVGMPSRLLGAYPEITVITLMR